MSASIRPGEDLLRRLLEVLQTKRLRTGQLLAEANVADRRVGEDAVWLLVQRGLVVIGPDSTLRVTDETKKLGRKKAIVRDRVSSEAR